MSSDGMTFGRAISKARKTLGLSQKELAARVMKEEGGGVLAIARRGDNGDGAVAGLLARQDRAGPEADPPRPASGAILDHVALAPARQHAQPEAGDLAVPDEVFGGAGFCGVDEAFGDPGHGTLRWFFRRSTVLKRGRQSTNTLKSRRKRKWRAALRKAFQRADAGNRRAQRIRTQVPQIASDGVLVCRGPAPA